MGPKKAEEPEKKPLIGRVGTNLKIGIVGVPNVGKVIFVEIAESYFNAAHISTVGKLVSFKIFILTVHILQCINKISCAS